MNLDLFSPPSNGPFEFTLLDFETSGLEPTTDEIIEIGAIRVRVGVDGLEKVASYETLVKPKRDVPRMILELTGITRESLDTAHPLDQIADQFVEFLGRRPMLAHNNAMEEGFLRSQVGYRMPPHFTVYDSIDLFALLYPERSSHALESLRTAGGLSHENSHRALQDCEDVFTLLKQGEQELKGDRADLRALMVTLFSDHPLYRAYFGGDAGSKGEQLPLSAAEIEAMLFAKRRKLNTLTATSEVNRHIPELTTEQLFTRLNATMREQKLEARPSQHHMALAVDEAFEKKEKIAIEAPTGTGKSLAYLLPSLLRAAREDEAVLISTHSKNLQDQLIESEIPRAISLIQSVDPKFVPSPTALLKGQANYICLRKTYDLLSPLIRKGVKTEEERFAVAYFGSLLLFSPRIELDRVSAFMKRKYPTIDAWTERFRSLSSTTIGPPCTFYSQCHYFSQAREAQKAKVLISNHALTFEWPSYFPKIKRAIFDEAHHLEDRFTEAGTQTLPEAALYAWLKRATRDGGVLLTTFFERATATGSSEKSIRAAESALSAMQDVQGLLKLLRDQKGGDSGYQVELPLHQLNPEMRRGLVEIISKLESSVRSLIETVIEPYQTLRDSKQNSEEIDQIGNGIEILVEAMEVLELLLKEPENDPKTPDPWLRLVSYHPYEMNWSLRVVPIDVKSQVKTFFSRFDSTLLTSATLAVGPDPDLLIKRIDFPASKPLLRLPSPFALAEQLRLFIPSDVAPPGTPSHFDSLVEFTASSATALEGRTLLLVTNNRRLKQAADILRERLEPKGIRVFDSLADRRAKEHFLEAPKAVLIGGERYGEGLDLPPGAIRLLVIEKMNESMTRGPLAEARKSRSKFALFDFDFPLRMIWLKQRIGRLIRSKEHRGIVVIFEPRYNGWSETSRNWVRKTLEPVPIELLTREQIMMEIENAPR